jgi:hypothetical protein
VKAINEMFNWNGFSEKELYDHNENTLNNSHIYDSPSFIKLNNEENVLREIKSPFNNNTLVRSAYDWNNNK